jgi:hypothetical protein
MKYITLILVLLSFNLEAQVTIKIDAQLEKKAISPYLYGRNNSLSTDPGKVLNINWTMLKDAGVTFFRESGGNNCTKYNWRKKISSHPDWYNNVYSNDWSTAAQALKSNMPNAQGMWAFQLLGKVAKTTQANFSDWDYNKSQWWEGVNQNLAGKGTPNTTGTKAKIEGDINLYLENWTADSTVAILDNWFSTKGLGLDKTKVQYWNMDNEAEIWSGTHDDVMPVQITAEEFMQKYFQVAKKARAAYPNIKLVGPVTANEWQWFRWGAANITSEGKTYPWLEYFIKRIAEEQKATGIKLLDVMDIHYYPNSKTIEEVVQYHRVFFDKEYSYPEANGLRTLNGGYDNSLTKEYIFGRINEWLDKYLGIDHGVTLGLTESGLNITDPNANAVWYASTMGEFMKNKVEIFTPWSWSIGMWETLHLFSRYNKTFSIKSTSSDENVVSAYPSINATQDSMTIMVVNRSATLNKTTTINIDNFIVGNTSAKTLTLKSLPSTETFISHTQNALIQGNSLVSNNSLSLTLAPMSITAIQLSGKVGQAAVVLATESEPDFQINVYPNPFSEAFIIDLGNVKAHKIEIVNMFGNTVFTQNIHSIDNKATINAQLKAGKYLLKIYKDKQEPIVKTLLAQ